MMDADLSTDERALLESERFGDILEAERRQQREAEDYEAKMAAGEGSILCLAHEAGTNGWR